METKHQKLTNAQLELLWVLNLKLSASELKKLKQTLLAFVDEITQKQLDKYIKNGKFPSDKVLKKTNIHKLPQTWKE